MNRIAVLGATGSIGTSGLDVIAAHRDRLQAVALTTHSRWEDLARQCQQHHPRYAVIGGESLAAEVDRRQFPAETELLFGPESIEHVARLPEVDTVLCGIVGAAGERFSPVCAIMRSLPEAT